MAVSKGRLVALLLLALVLVNIQCVAFCAVQSCDDGGTASTPVPANAPPCHRHHPAPTHQDSASCRHDLGQAVIDQTVIDQTNAAKAAVTQSPAAGDLAANLPVVSPIAFSLLRDVANVPAHAPSPPGLDPVSSVVLRI